MLEKRSPGAGATADALDVQRAAFLATLSPAGYAEKTWHDKRRAVASFIRWVRDARIALDSLDERCMATFLARKARRHPKDRAPAALSQFLEHLRAAGVVPPRPAKPSPSDLLLRRFLDHLRDDRGLCHRSTEVYAPLVHAFILAQRLPEGVAALDAVGVRRYLLEHSRNRSYPVVHLLAAALRSFLRFCFMHRMTATDLSAAVPPVRRWQYAPVPPFLKGEEVERVIATTDSSTKHGCRTLAILLLLARIGLRAGEVVSLELDDIRWDAGELLVRGKGRRHDRLPLPRDVGRALARYLHMARGPSTSRRLFLRRIAPHVGLSGPSAVGAVVREALRRAGLRPSGRVGAHVFRHSLATQMIRRGASLTEISQALRHRSILTTQLYARVELEALRGVALPWPSAEVQR